MMALRDLLVRVEKATGPDRELDADIHEAFAPRPDSFRREGFEWIDPKMPSVRFAPDRFTASIDTVMALVEKRFPRVFLELSGPRRYLNIPTPVPNVWRAELSWDHGTGWGSTMPLAILSALLRSEIAKAANPIGEDK